MDKEIMKGAQPQTAQEMYNELVSIREPYLERARQSAELTIPALLPQEGQKGLDLPTPWQSLGASAVNTLSSKVTLTLMPPATAFFKFELSNETKQTVNANGPEAMAQVEQTLIELEERVMKNIEGTADRVAISEASKQLIVAGNVLIHQPAKGSMRVFKLNQYVVRRDPSGNPIRIVLKECISPLALPQEILDAAHMSGQASKAADGSLDIYTVIQRENIATFKTYQEINDMVVEGTEGTIPASSMSYLPLRWARSDGEDYGRSHVEEYLGDFNSLEGLERAIVEGSAASAKIVYLRNPGSATSAEEFSHAENGDVVDGSPQDFVVVQAQKFADLQVAQAEAAKLEQRLARAFLMVSSVQRQAERVTAEEIRIMAGELEESLGGIYSTLALELQLPYIKRKMALMSQSGELPQFPPGTLAPTIVTGLAALGRNAEVAKIMSWANACSSVIGPEAFAGSVNSDQLLKKFGTGFGVKVNEIVKSAEQMQQEQQAAQQQSNMQTMGPEVIRAQANKQQQ